MILRMLPQPPLDPARVRTTLRDNPNIPPRAAHATDEADDAPGAPRREQRTEERDEAERHVPHVRGELAPRGQHDRRASPREGHEGGTREDGVHFRVLRCVWVHVQIGEDEVYAKYGRISQPGRRRKSKTKDDDDEAAEVSLKHALRPPRWGPVLICFP